MHASSCTWHMYIHHNRLHEVIYLSDNSCNICQPTITHTHTQSFAHSILHPVCHHSRGWSIRQCKLTAMANAAFYLTMLHNSPLDYRAEIIRSMLCCLYCSLAVTHILRRQILIIYDIGRHLLTAHTFWLKQCQHYTLNHGNVLYTI